MNFVSQGLPPSLYDSVSLEDSKESQANQSGDLSHLKSNEKELDIAANRQNIANDCKTILDGDLKATSDATKKRGYDRVTGHLSDEKQTMS